MEIFISILVLLVLLTGLVGTLVPILPGIALMWVGVLGYGFLAGFDALGIGVVVAVTALTALGIGLGFVLPQQAATAAGASKKSQFAAILGAIIGFFVIPVVGALVGVVVGIALAEYFDKGAWAPAWVSTKGVMTGMGAAALAQFAVGVVILWVWLVWAALTLA